MVLPLCVSGVKEVVERFGDAPCVIYGSQVPYILGTCQETSSLMRKITHGKLGYDTFCQRIRDEGGGVSTQGSFLPLAMGARLVTKHARFMPEHGASLNEVRRYIDDNLVVLQELGESGIPDRADFACALSLLHSCRHYSGARRPHTQVSLNKGGELCEVSVDAPGGYHFRPLEAVAVLHEAIGSEVIGPDMDPLRNEFIFHLHDVHDAWDGLSVAVIQYEPSGGERKRVGSLRFRVSDTSIRTKGDSSINVLPSTIASLASGVPLDDILRVNDSRAA